MRVENEARPGWRATGRASANGQAGATDHNHSTTDGLFFNARGQLVGRMQGGWLTKRVSTRAHQLRRPPAWCIDRAHLGRLEALGAAGVVLVDETGAEWRATVAEFRLYGIPIDRGHGEQVALPLARWRRAVAGQLALFGEVAR